jgi:hypothetical protein
VGGAVGGGGGGGKGGGANTSAAASCCISGAMRHRSCSLGQGRGADIVWFIHK